MFIWEQQTIAVQDMGSKPHASPEKQRRGLPFYGRGKNCHKQGPLQETESSKHSDFSPAELRSLPLPELLLDKEESFPPPTEVENYHFLWQVQGTSLPVGVSGMCGVTQALSLIHISEPTRPKYASRMPSAA